MRRTEQGNAVFIIMIAVALFAALTFVISSGRDTGTRTLDEEEARIVASEIIQFGDGVGIAVERLLRMGADELNAGSNGVLFAAPGANAQYGVPGTQPKTEVFHPLGGGMIYAGLPPGACSAACDYEFTSQIQVTDLGTAKYELAMIVFGIDPTVCTLLNKIWQNGFAATPTEDVLTLTRFDGSDFGEGGGVANLVAIGGVMAGKKAFCYRESAGGQRYIYVHVLKRR